MRSNSLNERMLTTISNLSKLSESKSRSHRYKCPRCSAISEGVKIEGADEVCPLCDTELKPEDKYYEIQSELNAVKESCNLEEGEDDELIDKVDELEDVRESYINYVKSGRLYKARKLLEENEVEAVVDQEGVTEEGDVEEDAITLESVEELEDGSEVTLKVGPSDDIEECSTNESDDEELDDEDEEIFESARRSLRRTNTRRFRMSEAVEGASSIASAVEDEFHEMQFDVLDISESTGNSVTTVDVVVRSSKESADSYLEDIVARIAERTHKKVDFSITGTDGISTQITLEFRSNSTVTESADSDEVDELLDDTKEELVDELSDVVESHRRKHRNHVIRESLDPESDANNLSEEEDLEVEGEELEDDLVATVESKARKLKLREEVDDAGKEIIEQNFDDLIKEVEEITESYTRKRILRRLKLVESATKSTIEDVIDTDEDLLEEVTDEVSDKVEEVIDNTKEELKDSDDNYEPVQESSLSRYMRSRYRKSRR